jgi:hypothetical protein
MSSIELELNIFFKKLANSNDNENKNKRLCYLYYDLPTIEKILKGVNSNKKRSMNYGLKDWINLKIFLREMIKDGNQNFLIGLLK